MYRKKGRAIVAKNILDQNNAQVVVMLTFAQKDARGEYAAAHDISIAALVRQTVAEKIGFKLDVTEGVKITPVEKKALIKKAVAEFLAAKAAEIEAARERIMIEEAAAQEAAGSVQV